MNEEFLQKFPEILFTLGKIADKQNVELYVVGGFVRDLLLQTGEKKDIDFSVIGDAVSFAKSLQSEIGARNVVVYERFGTAMTEVEGFKLEFVTAREESYSADSRKPKVKKADLISDLSRRDFTINTLTVGLNEKNRGKLYDPFNGIRDIEKKMIRTPLDPEMTFNDDPLRILRAVRFAATLNFEIEMSTKEAIKKMASRLKIVSAERITDELLKILSGKKPSTGFLLLSELEVLPFVIPEMIPMKGVEQRNDFHHKDVFFHTLKVVDNVAAVSEKLPLRLTALFHDVAKPRTKRFDEKIGWTFHGHDEIGARMMEKIANRMRLSRHLKEYSQKLIRLHLRPIFLAGEGVTDSAVRRLIVQAGEELDDLILLCRADITSGNPERVQKHLQNFDLVMARVQEVREKDALRKFQSPVRGDEIMEICQLQPGPEVGRIKKAIEEAILDGVIKNEYDEALNYLYEIKDEYLKNTGKKNM
ncbi:MAG TPA: HD domain-containing protein [Bacteroidetes bacterium]|nr:HD domain-containing protein [Bacteroidota bacterium]